MRATCYVSFLDGHRHLSNPTLLGSLSKGRTRTDTLCALGSEFAIIPVLGRPTLVKSAELCYAVVFHAAVRWLYCKVNANVLMHKATDASVEAIGLSRLC